MITYRISFDFLARYRKARFVTSAARWAPLQSPSTSFRATPVGVTSSALPRYVAAKIDRSTIELGCRHLGVVLDDHLANLVRFLAPLP